MLGAPDLFLAVETARLSLRCLRSTDASQLSGLMTPAISQTLASWPVPFTVEMASERIIDFREAAADGTSLPCAIERKQDQVVLGWIGLMCQKERPRTAKLGYWLGEPYQGHGYAKEAACAGISAAFALLDVSLVEAAVEVENGASFSVLRSCGMTQVDERMIFAPAKGREHLCAIFQVARAVEDDGYSRL